MEDLKTFFIVSGWLSPKSTVGPKNIFCIRGFSKQVLSAHCKLRKWDSIVGIKKMEVYNENIVKYYDLVHCYRLEWDEWFTSSVAGPFPISFVCPTSQFPGGPSNVYSVCVQQVDLELSSISKKELWTTVNDTLNLQGALKITFQTKSVTKVMKSATKTLDVVASIFELNYPRLKTASNKISSWLADIYTLIAWKWKMSKIKQNCQNFLYGCFFEHSCVIVELKKEVLSPTNGRFHSWLSS